MTLLVARARDGLARLADPLAAGPMQAYMKSAMPFRGVPKPAHSSRTAASSSPASDTGCSARCCSPTPAS